jgi:hypothetical protein
LAVDGSLGCAQAMNVSEYQRRLFCKHPTVQSQAVADILRHLTDDVHQDSKSFGQPSHFALGTWTVADRERMVSLLWSCFSSEQSSLHLASAVSGAIVELTRRRVMDWWVAVAGLQSALASLSPHIFIEGASSLVRGMFALLVILNDKSALGDATQELPALLCSRENLGMRPRAGGQKTHPLIAAVAARPSFWTAVSVEFSQLHTLPKERARIEALWMLLPFVRFAILLDSRLYLDSVDGVGSIWERCQSVASMSAAQITVTSTCLQLGLHCDLDVSSVESIRSQLKFAESIIDTLRLKSVVPGDDLMGVLSVWNLFSPCLSRLALHLSGQRSAQLQEAGHYDQISLQIQNLYVVAIHSVLELLCDMSLFSIGGTLAEMTLDVAVAMYSDYDNLWSQSASHEKTRAVRSDVDMDLFFVSYPALCLCLLDLPSSAKRGRGSILKMLALLNQKITPAAGWLSQKIQSLAMVPLLQHLMAIEAEGDLIASTGDSALVSDMLKSLPANVANAPTQDSDVVQFLDNLKQKV